MLTYVLRRIAMMVPSVAGIIMITFILTRVLPGDPALMITGEQALPEFVEKVREQYGFNQPLLVQFWDYLKQLIRGDFGFAWHTGHSVAADFISRFPATLELTFASMAIALIVALPLGIIAASRQNSIFDHIARVLSFLGSSVPIFWLGLLLITLFYSKLGWLPAPIGRISASINPPTHITGLYVLDSLLSWDLVALKDSLLHLLLPAFCLSMGTMAIVTKMIRASMLEVIRQDFMRTARAKGLSERAVIYKHGLINSLIPTLTVIGLQFGYLLGGAVITETIFVWPGVGNYVTESILSADYAPIQAMTLISAVLYGFLNLTVELLYGVLDPRVRYE
ncbi:ABC transporter permease [Paenibacillus baekrokdamisoli]|uniref:ABC transporter permease n=1 Tax=Paenibacillus baekrokdamisoli TaxID=1712516 RepID=A0A3G9IX18_9BACL|nr:ABC transporter permease [Paenibacillus baekrokdamisoli]MBB3068624.1 peptide/nickel transport system permease protein [Paenibacillus baekrokdamisoli]BBH23457.1 ABC transporter permease [Paenibacillus baekrokdamisoli]